jgi:hypothetical protein
MRVGPSGFPSGTKIRIVYGAADIKLLRTYQKAYVMT